jgi:Mn2+/Fe2+ NRAMP family transporter
VIATIIGIILNFSRLDPIQALYWSAVINGILSAPIMAVMMRMASDHRVMGKLVLPRKLKVIGWIATGVMGLCVVALLATAVM